MRKHLWAVPCALGVALALGTRFAHPDHTETRLLLDFWPVWLAVLALAAVSVALVAWAGRDGAR